MDVTDRLRQLGLGEYEARAYAALVAHPGNTGYEVAKHARIPRAKVYETLAALVGRDLAATSREGDRVRYHPLDPNVLLRRYLADAEALVSGLEPLLRQLADPEEAPPLITVRSYEHVLTRTRDVLAAAERRAFVSAWPAEIEALASELVRAEEREVQVHALVYGDTAVALPRLFHHHPLGPREDEPPWPPRAGPLPWLVVVADHSEALIAQAAPRDQAVALWTRQPAVAMVAAEFVKHSIFFTEIDRLLTARGLNLDRELWPLQRMWFELDDEGHR